MSAFLFRFITVIVGLRFHTKSIISFCVSDVYYHLSHRTITWIFFSVYYTPI